MNNYSVRAETNPQSDCCPRHLESLRLGSELSYCRSSQFSQTSNKYIHIFRIFEEKNPALSKAKNNYRNVQPTQLNPSLTISPGATTVVKVTLRGLNSSAYLIFHYHLTGAILPQLSKFQEANSFRLSLNISQNLRR